MAGDPAAPLGPGALREAFGEAHEARYGYRDRQAELELVNLRVSAWGAAPALRGRTATEQLGEPEARTVIIAGEPVTARLFRGEPPAGTRLSGPALCALAGATLLIPPGWGGEVDANGTIRLTRRQRS